MKFTIGLPITKTNFLAETLESIAGQTFGDFELIIRNNGLTQEIKEQVKEMCLGWIGRPNVVYTQSGSQLKIADNFNEIVKIASGDYFTVLSDDDILHPDFLKEFEILSQKYPAADVLHCRVKVVNQERQLVRYSELCPEFESLPDFMYHRLIGARWLFLSDFVVSAKALKNIGGFPVKSQGWGVDSLTWHLLGRNGIGYTPKSLLEYRVNTANFTNSPNNLVVKLEDLVYMRDELKKIIGSEPFQKQSAYPAGFLLEKNEERFRSDSEEVLSDLCRANNLFRFYRYYQKYRGPYSFTSKTLFKLILKKLFLKDFRHN